MFDSQKWELNLNFLIERHIDEMSDYRFDTCMYYVRLLKINVYKSKVKNKYDVKKEPYLKNIKKKYKISKKIFLL